jgi:ABC-type lipoprotein export system ATPase subunit
LLAGETRLLLTGPAGSGKTTLLHEIARVLRYVGWKITINIADASQDSEPVGAGTHSALLSMRQIGSHLQNSPERWARASGRWWWRGSTA